MIVLSFFSRYMDALPDELVARIVHHLAADAEHPLARSRQLATVRSTCRQLFRASRQAFWRHIHLRQSDVRTVRWLRVLHASRDARELVRVVEWLSTITLVYGEPATRAAQPCRMTREEAASALRSCKSLETLSIGIPIEFLLPHLYRVIRSLPPGIGHLAVLMSDQLVPNLPSSRWVPAGGGKDLEPAPLDSQTPKLQSLDWSCGQMFCVSANWPSLTTLALERFGVSPSLTVRLPSLRSLRLVATRISAMVFDGLEKRLQRLEVVDMIAGHFEDAERPSDMLEKISQLQGLTYLRFESTTEFRRADPAAHHSDMVIGGFPQLLAGGLPIEEPATCPLPPKLQELVLMAPSEPWSWTSNVVAGDDPRLTFSYACLLVTLKAQGCPPLRGLSISFCYEEADLWRDDRWENEGAEDAADEEVLEMQAREKYESLRKDLAELAAARNIALDIRSMQYTVDERGWRAGDIDKQDL